MPENVPFTLLIFYRSRIEPRSVNGYCLMTAAQKSTQLQRIHRRGLFGFTLACVIRPLSRTFVRTPFDRR